MKLQGTSLILRHDSHHVTMAYKEKHTPSYFGRSSYEQNYRPTHISDKIPATLPFWERLSKTKSPQCFFLTGAPKRKMGLSWGKLENSKGNSQRWCSKTVHLPMLQRRSQPGANPSSWIHLEKNARKKFTPKMVGYNIWKNPWIFLPRAVQRAVNSEDIFVFFCWTKNEHLIFWLLG